MLHACELVQTQESQPKPKRPRPARTRRPVALAFDTEGRLHDVVLDVKESDGENWPRQKARVSQSEPWVMYKKGRQTGTQSDHSIVTIRPFDHQAQQDRQVRHRADEDCKCGWCGTFFCFVAIIGVIVLIVYFAVVMWPNNNNRDGCESGFGDSMIRVNCQI